MAEDKIVGLYPTHNLVVFDESVILTLELSAPASGGGYYVVAWKASRGRFNQGGPGQLMMANDAVSAAMLRGAEGAHTLRIAWLSDGVPPETPVRIEAVVWEAPSTVTTQMLYELGEALSVNPTDLKQEYKPVGKTSVDLTVVPDQRQEPVPVVVSSPSAGRRRQSSNAPHVRVRINQDGGRVELKDPKGVLLARAVFPAGALDDETFVSITQLPGSGSRVPPAPDQADLVSNGVFDFRAVDTDHLPVRTFARPVQVTFSLASLPQGTTTPAMSFFNPETEDWQSVDGTVQSTGQTITITGTTTHFSPWAVFALVRLPPAPPPPPRAPVPVSLTRTFEPSTNDQTLWMLIRQSTDQLAFTNYSRYMDMVLCLDQATSNTIPNPPFGFPSGTPKSENTEIARLAIRRSLPFPDVDAYRVLKAATERFMQVFCGVAIEKQPVPAGTSPQTGSPPWSDPQTMSEEKLRIYQALTSGDVANAWNQFVTPFDPRNPSLLTLPYLELVLQNLNGVPFADGPKASQRIVSLCEGVIRQKLAHPCFVELIWSYWHEEGMLVQSMKAIAWRFQNRRGPTERDPLAMLEIDPLRPLSNLLWGYIQDEQHRLSVPRRAYEYDHHYGLTLLGKAVPPVRGADTRSRFIEAFHNLIYLCSIFYKEDDDTTVVADGFPILNALREVHLLLTQGAHNQYGDLPWTARQEMLMEEWLLARPEFREYLPRRVMVDYPESWMHSVETMKTLQGWTDTSVLHFRDLGVFGERIVLSIRFRDWTSEIHPESAANWARYWRPEIQGYAHGYRAVTGADLTDHVDTTPPSELLRRRLPRPVADALAQRSGGRAAAAGLPPRRTGSQALPQRRATPALSQGPRSRQGEDGEWNESLS